VTRREGARTADGASGKGVGARLRRKEDARFLRGRGEYVGNIRMVGMLDVAFVRSPVAHARIRAVRKPAGHEHAVVAVDDLAGVGRSSPTRRSRASNRRRSTCSRSARCARSASRCDVPRHARRS
jgi:hypothetical protein